MEKAILKTLVYADIFNYPLKTWEIHKWLIGRKVSLYQIEKTLDKLRVKGKAVKVKEYYCLPRRAGLVGKRFRRLKQSTKYLRKAQILASLLKLIPWIKLVGISGGLAMENASKRDDIDLFIITSKNRLWVSRLFIIGLLSLTGQRRRVGEKGVKIAGKICVNTLLEEGKLEQTSKDIYLAHEVLQMKILWQRGGVYSKYLLDNEWAFKFLPNWIASDASLRGLKGRSNLEKRLPREHSSLAMTMVENLAKRLQLKVMKKPEGMERIEDGALYFHPQDCRPQVLQSYRQKVKEISTT